MENFRKVVSVLLCIAISIVFISCATNKAISTVNNQDDTLSSSIAEQKENNQTVSQAQLSDISGVSAVDKTSVPETTVTRTFGSVMSTTIQTTTSEHDILSSDSSTTQVPETFNNGSPIQTRSFESRVDANRTVVDESGKIDTSLPIGADVGNERKSEEEVVIQQNDLVPGDLIDVGRSPQREDLKSFGSQGTETMNNSVVSKQTPEFFSEPTVIQSENSVSSPDVAAEPKKIIWPFVIIVAVGFVVIVMLIILKERKKGRRSPVVDLIDDPPIESSKQLITVSCPYEVKGDQSSLHVLTTLELSGCSLSGTVTFAEAPENGFPFQENLESSKDEMERVLALSQSFRKVEDRTEEEYIKNHLNARFHSISWNFNVYSEEQDVPKIKLAFMLKSLSANYELFYSSYQNIVGKIDDCDFSRLNFKGKRQ